jgi:hypothetical protein
LHRPGKILPSTPPHIRNGPDSGPKLGGRYYRRFVP